MKSQMSIPETPNKIPSSGEIQVWYASLDRPVSEYLGLLSQGERNRAERFVFEQDRVRYTVLRGLLRILLGGYIGIRPELVRINYGEHGKPLIDKYHGVKLHFSLSSSQGLGIYAFSGDSEIGIDIEQVRDIPHMGQIFGRFFSPRENEVFLALSESERQEAFFNCWTRKEAFIKATGDGLFRPLDEFDVSFVPGEPARLLEIEGGSDEALRWTMYEFKDISPGFVAALAVKGQVRNVDCRRWTA